MEIHGAVAKILVLTAFIFFFLLTQYLFSKSTYVLNFSLWAQNLFG